MTHDYKRNGTTSLYAALEIASGEVTGACYPRHTHQEFLTFLNRLVKAYPRRPLHVVLDNSSTHSTPEVNAWLARHPTVHFHFTPTSSASWLNMVEGWSRPHQAASPPRRLSRRPGADRFDPALHRRLQRPSPTVRLDQDRRAGPHQGHPKTRHFRNGALVVAEHLRLPYYTVPDALCRQTGTVSGRCCWPGSASKSARRTRTRRPMCSAGSSLVDPLSELLGYANRRGGAVRCGVWMRRPRFG